MLAFFPLILFRKKCIYLSISVEFLSTYFQLNQKEKEREKYTVWQAASMIYCKEIIIIDSFFMMGLLVSSVLAGSF